MEEKTDRECGECLKEITATEHKDTGGLCYDCRDEQRRPNVNDEKSRYATGGLDARYAVARTDGRPCAAAARYFVLDCGRHPDGTPRDPHAVLAAESYMTSVRKDNGRLCADLRAVLIDGPWPAALAQHADAEEPT